MDSFYQKNARQLPVDYRNFVEVNAPFEGDLGDQLGYVRLWSPQEIDESYVGYEMEEFLSPSWFPIGSNMGGEMLVLNRESGEEAVYRLPFIGMSDDDPWILCDSFRDLIRVAKVTKNLARIQH